MPHSNRIFQTASILFIIFLPAASFCQNKTLSCQDVRTGKFYIYPKNTNRQLLLERNNDMQKETDLTNGDTSLWKVLWKNDCVFTTKYISGNSKITEEALAFMKKHKILYEIKNVTADYFTYQTFIDKTTNLPIESDTVWMHKKENFVSNKIFEPLTNNKDLHKPHFTDTAKYALLYVYRPGKLTNSLSNYPLYFDGNIMCFMKNNSGYIFKILKEGSFEIRSNLLNDESSVKLDVKFGNRYYAKSMMHWGIQKNLNNFKLEIKIMPNDTGEEEFDKVELNK